ncbi:MAG: hypothetical protein ACD_17C00003G0004 [uncultured bacterium]|nr:MAG: hypothetical protein ACD_17C00003G0004 [uncultured bacterium]OGN56632.1 MAG: hypothetical protein A2796_03605 [Chlamydiae bacterium RIFCSPHIGHO2_01_FULL_44_39]OGN59129.1 MAG: hypothetical protein A3C42_02620 [Chlamydiae bacterium RIFCSPHIGHO2_02_FULL_45_9]OGN61140.1 MAG: hypothetical protein A3D96_05775 [Chlamydiae bacterium RIFCSPHIGHO2_12_FULL_44_59]OGN65610.1 MAG: hypothetical protein A2978_06580 [Chlamydiae bacterium RIFCSPLOWO2_01_FULL_44_52]OGN68087.1 MAG: hypothetical protein A3
MKKVLILLALFFFSLSLGKSVYWLKDGFSFRRIHSLTRQDDLGLDDSVHNALSQTFYYLGRGRQCFAFASEDGKYVLKFPRTDIYSTPFWARVLPVPTYRTRLESAHKERERLLRNSFQLSFHFLQEETGLIAVHLGQTEKDSRMLTVVDAAGSTHRFPLYKTSFVLQFKYPLLIPAFSKALEKGDQEGAQKILDALIDVIVMRAKQGILNRDRSFLRNYGYDGRQAYQIDIGSFFTNDQLEETAVYQKSIQDSIDPIQEWLQEKAPAMLPRLKQRVDTELNNKLASLKDC